MIFSILTLACTGEETPIDTGEVVEPDEVCTLVGYVDADGDGWGDLSTAQVVCELGDLVARGGDCDDDNPVATPEKAWYFDADGDGFGDPARQIASCEPQDGLVDDDTDCNDLDAAFHPGADEDDCTDPNDYNCDGSVAYADADADGYPACEDCDDTDGEVNPDGVEVCDGVDNDCDGTADYDGWVPEDYATIQDAFDAKDDGLHLCLSDGTHVANDLEYGAWLTLEGGGSDLVVLDAQASSFLDITGDLSISGVHITNASSEDDYRPGIEQFEGDAWFSDVEFSEFESLTYSSDFLIYKASGVGDLTLVDVHVHDITDHHEDYGNYGGLFSGWGGDLVVEGLLVEDVETSGGWGQSPISYWGVNIAMSDVVFRNIDVEVNPMEYSPSWDGFLDLDAYQTIEIDGLTVTGVTIVAESGAGTLDLDGPLLGWVSAYSSATLRHLSVTDNTLDTAGDVEIAPLLFRTYSEIVEVENAVIAGNVLGEASTFEGLVYGYSTRWTNVDVVDNDFGYAEEWDPLFNSYDGLELANVNLVGNSGEAEVGSYTWMSAYGEDGVGASYVNVYDNDLPGDADALVNWAATSLSDLGVTTTFDPLYVDADAGDYTLASGSPAIDAGSPDILDADGSVSDLGAYGGPNGDSW